MTLYTTPNARKELFSRCAINPLHVQYRWAGFAGGFTVGGLSGVGFAYVLTQILPYYR